MAHRKTTLISSAILAATLTLTACTPEEDLVPDPDEVVEEDADEQDVEVEVDEEIRSQIDVEPGSAVVPGSVDSETVTTLSGECDDAVSQLRELAEQYDSVRQVPPDGTYEDARAAAEDRCDAQDWSDFYTQELAGWIYAE